MASNEEIIVIANKLANQGKKPSVALIKSRLTSPIPLPVIISTLKVWQHEPDYITCETTVTKTQSEPLSEEITEKIAKFIRKAVATELTPLKDELSKLRMELAQLKAER